MEGVCLGAINGVGNVGPALIPDLKLCIPKGIPHKQLVEEVIRYAERRPDLGNAPFALVAALAMHNKWPCKE
jgi:Rap1a immunity proteins